VLDTEDRLGKALAVAYRYLNPRERTGEEVRGHLAGKGFDARDVDQTLELLTENGYVDDVRFARLFVHDKRELDEWGSERIRRVLLSRGIDSDLAEDALAEAEANDPGGRDTGGELGRAVALLRRRFPALTWDRRERDRALGMLMRKGYDSELALDAIASYARDAAGS
jgi:regulatory protein